MRRCLARFRRKVCFVVSLDSEEQGSRSHGVPVGENFETFDVLMGCDGARSRVRESQKQIFGEVRGARIMKWSRRNLPLPLP